jgi:acetyl esterase/lipase
VGVLVLRGARTRDPLISPVNAELRGLPPLYVQAGGAGILYDMIAALVERAREQDRPKPSSWRSRRLRPATRSRQRDGDPGQRFGDGELESAC